MLQKAILPLVLLSCILLPTQAADLVAKKVGDKIEVTRVGNPKPIVTQNARSDFRPYLHPIVAPDGKGELTEYSPGHHKHQTGLYWGFTRVNGRDYFHHPEGDYWKRVSFDVIQSKGHEVSWRTVYNLLDADGKPVMRETQTWSMHEHDGEYLMELEWKGDGVQDVTVGKYDYGGLFLRMPWKRGMNGQATNAVRQVNGKAEGQRATWVDVGLQLEGRDDQAHIAIFDHGKNKGFPQHWRVDGQLGIGPIRAREGDWSIKKGETEVIRHGVHVYTGELNDVELTKKFSEYANTGPWAMWKIAQREGRAAKFLSPQAAVDAMTLQPGMKASVFASEPMITQPMAFCWDDKGRMWIAENRDYENRRKGFANFGDSRILILEDTDKDGVADKKTVFAEGIPFPSAMAIGFDGLWLGAVPNLLFVPDKNKDDKADMDDIEVRLTGWGIRDRHETLNSFHWGPDGWLYGLQGFATPSRVGKPKGDGKLYKHNDPFPTDIEFEGEPMFLDGGVWRYHPTKKRFEVVAHGFSNPWGVDYDAKGQLFISACVIPHLWHVVPGGIYHRQGGRHINPHYYSDIRTIADHRHRSAHGGARIYIGDAMPKKYHNRIFMANIHEHAVLTDVLEPKGSGFVGRHGDDFLLANNAQWIGFSMEIGPGGDIYVLDWHDADICGNDVVHKDTGRVFRIASTEVKAENWEGRYDDLETFSDARLVALQTSKSAWHARRARVILQHRAGSRKMDADALASLRELYKNGDNADYRLRAMWALHVAKQLSMSDLEAALYDKDEHIRAWAIQLGTENGPDGAVLDLSPLASGEDSPIVRLYLASALQRVPVETVGAVSRVLMSYGEDADDHNIPKMIWFGIEKHVPEHPEYALELASESKIPMLTRFIARRLADADMLSTLVGGINNEGNAAVQAELLNGMFEGIRGRVDLKAPSNWSSLYAKLDKNSDVGQIATEVAQQFGDVEAVNKAIATLKDASASEDDRRQALQSLAKQQREEIIPTLKKLLGNATLRRDAIRAMASFDDNDLPELLLEKYSSFNADEKLDAVQTMASRRKSARMLTEAIDSGKVPKRDVPAYVARQMRRVVGNTFVDVWGPIDALSADKDLAFEKYRRLLTKENLAKADSGHGRELFKRTCYACHKLYGEGGAVGPEITGANRSNLEYILGNVLTPSVEIQDAYKMTIVLTDEGRTYSGIVAGENNRQLMLRVANEPEPVSIAKSTIESREIAPVSMMPEGLLGTLKDDEVIDLVSYLQTTKQVPAK